MKLSMLAIQRLPECSRIPWWMRVAWWDVPYHTAIVLPIGIHWIARQAHTFWLWTYRYRGSRWEQALLAAEARGHSTGYTAGHATALGAVRNLGCPDVICDLVASGALFLEETHGEDVAKETQDA